MNRKWLVLFTFCLLILGLSLLGAQSSPQSPAQPPAPPPPAADEAQIEWFAGDALEPFTIELGPDATPGVPLDEAGLPFLEPAIGDAVFFYSAADAMDFGPETPELMAGMAFGGPDSQGEPAAGTVSFERSVPFVGADPQDTITFVGFEAGLGNQSVTGAPYSAQVTSEFQQTLSDGNKIERKTTSIVYRDGQGRTRREQTLPAIGNYSASGQPPQAIFINDPVAGVSYVLDPVRKIARKMTRPNVRFLQRRGPEGEAGTQQGGAPPRPARPNARRGDANVTTESLGTQNMEGILVEGTRVVRLVPAGRVGNEQPIRITSERWYSPELNLNVLVKNTDPMRGENITTLSNIRRDEPAATLFQVPSDYTVQEPQNRLRRGPRGMAPPPPPPPPQQ
jgi:hypothetical protein